MINQMLKHSRSHLLVGLVLLVSSVVSIRGQQSAARPDRGFLTGASYSASDLDNISLSNGNLHLSIPLASLPPMAGGKLGLTLNAVYNSKLWNITRQQYENGTFGGCDSWVVDTPQVSDRGGWMIAGGYGIQIREAVEDFAYAVPDPLPDSCETNSYENNLLRNYNWYRVVLIGPDGAEHELRPVDNTNYYAGSRGYLYGYYRDTPQTLNTPMRYYTFDGSFISVVLNPNSYSTYFTATLKDGTKVVEGGGIQRITDTNGNSIKIFSDSYGAHMQDEQTGREIKYAYNASGNNGNGQSTIQYQTVGGTWESVYINWGTTQVKGKIYRINDWDPDGGEIGEGQACYYNGQIPATDLTVIREIVFPATEPTQDPRKFTFGYNSDTTTSSTASDVKWSCDDSGGSYTRTVSTGMGGLSEVDTPSGATITYEYTNDGKHDFSLFGDTDEIAREAITEKHVAHDGITDTWTYQIVGYSSCGGKVTAPDGSETIESCYPKGQEFGQGYTAGQFSGLTFQSIRAGKERIDRHWTSLLFSGGNAAATGVASAGNFNPVVDAEYLSLLDGSGNRIKMSAKTYQYDYNGNVTQETDYDWFDPSSVTFGSDGVPTGVPSGATVLRSTTTSYYNAATSNSSGNVYAKRSLTYGTPLILSAPQETTTGSAVARFSYDTSSYGTAPTVGNLTSKSVYDDVDSKWITTSMSYDSYGNMASSTDGRGKVTTLTYDSCTHAQPVSVSVNPDNGTGAQTSYTVYDCYTGLVTSTTDVNSQTTTIDYTNQLLSSVDPFGRPGVVSAPAVTIGSNSYHRKVTTTYVDHLRQVITESDLAAQNDKLLKTRVTSDELGRPILKEQTENGSDYTIFSKKVYDPVNRITYASNPMRCTIQSANSCSANPLTYVVTADTNGWTRSTSDALGRVTEVASFSGSSQPAATGSTNSTGSVSTTYDANFTTVSDQVGKTRRSMVDGLGRLVRVDEPDSGGSLGSTSSPNQATSYDYDAFGNLLHVYQGSQTRTFTYDTLSRLRTANNPETGTVTYDYDDNGNLTSKTDARSVTTTIAYDSINRPTQKSYSDSTPTVTYYYDSQSLPSGAPSYTHGYATGRLVACIYGSGSEGTYRGYDELGQTVRQYQRTDSVNYLVEATYNLAGSMATETYPSVPGASDRRTVSLSYDNAARLSSLSSSATSYAPAASVSSIAYAATNALTSQTYGNSLINAVSYNSRLQTSEIKLGTSSNSTSVLDLIYSYGTTSNNGNLQSVTYAGGGLSYTQSFTYDSLNRLATANETNGGSTNWSQANAYDRYGNRRIDYGGGTYNLAFSSSTNRITTSGYSYDSAGNLTNDTVHAYAFDAENKIKTVDSTTAYVYDGEGQRVRKLVGENKRFIYGVGGQLVAEFDGSSGNLLKEYINGSTFITIEPTAVNSNGAQYSTSDNLGSPRVVTNSSASVLSRHDYMPFGEELGASIGGRTSGMGFGIADGLRQKFTSKERDNETGLDYFDARYYGSANGRFSSTDPITMTLDRLQDPQQIHLYTYCRNNPLKFSDPTGEKIEYKNDRSETAYKEYVAYLEECGKKCEQELATVIQLKESDVTYVINVAEKAGQGEGELTTDGNKIFININNVGGPSGETFSRNTRFAHELEHGRQFDDGELSFYKDRKSGKWEANPNTYDIGDEVNAFKAQQHVAVDSDYWTNKAGGSGIKPSLLREFANAKTDDERAGVLSRTAYPGRNKHRDSNVVFGSDSGYKPGQLVRTSDYFARVNRVIERK